MKQQFTPMLVGRRSELITKETENWMNLIFSLNDFFSNWNIYFKEHLDLKELEIINQVPDLPFYIQKKYIEKNPQYQDFLNTLSVKLDKLIEMVNIPDFGHLIEAFNQVTNMIQKVTIKVKVRPFEVCEFDTWKTKIFNGENFEFTDELKNEITERNTVYTSNEHENAAFAYISKFCEMLNILNDLGYQTDPRAFPRTISFNIESFTTDKRILEPKAGNPDYYRNVVNYIPSCGMLSNDTGLINIFKNLDVDEIPAFLKKLLPNEK